jgi:hypothetical protein
MCTERACRVVYLVWVLRLQYGFLSSRHGCKQHKITIGVDGDCQRVLRSMQVLWPQALRVFQESPSTVRVLRCVDPRHLVVLSQNPRLSFTVRFAPVLLFLFHGPLMLPQVGRLESIDKRVLLAGQRWARAVASASCLVSP